MIFRRSEASHHFVLAFTSATPRLARRVAPISTHYIFFLLTSLLCHTLCTLCEVTSTRHFCLRCRSLRTSISRPASQIEHPEVNNFHAISRLFLSASCGLPQTNPSLTSNAASLFSVIGASITKKAYQKINKILTRTNFCFLDRSVGANSPRDLRKSISISTPVYSHLFRYHNSGKWLLHI